MSVVAGKTQLCPLDSSSLSPFFNQLIVRRRRGRFDVGDYVGFEEGTLTHSFQERGKTNFPGTFRLNGWMRMLPEEFLPVLVHSRVWCDDTSKRIKMLTGELGRLLYR